MAENRDQQIMVNIEPTLFDLVCKIAKKQGMSNSGYVRQLILNDLIAQGLMTPTIMQAVLVGGKK